MRYDCQQSTSIPRNEHPENQNGEGRTEPVATMRDRAEPE